MRHDKFYGNITLQRAMVAAAPFCLAAAASQQLNAQLTATDVASLRAHIATANASAADETINVNAGTYTLTGGPDGGTPNPASGDLDITKAAGNLTIVGATTATTIIDAASVDRVLHIAAATGGTVTLRNLTIRNGVAVDDGSVGAFPPEARGGGIYNESGTNLTLENVAVESNSASGFDGIGVGNIGGAALGGGLYNAGGNLTITACTFDSNGGQGGTGFNATFSTPAPAGGIAQGGGLYVTSGTVVISDSTITACSSTGGDGGNGYFGFGAPNAGGEGGAAAGGAIYFVSGGLTVTGSTIDNCAATGGNGGLGRDGNSGLYSGGTGGRGGSGGDSEGGALYCAGGTLALRNCTFSANSAQGGNAQDGGNGGNASHPTIGVGATAGDGGDAGSATGGGVFAIAGNVTLENCTLAGDNATAGTAGLGGTGGFGSQATGPAGAAGQTGTESGGNIAVAGAALTIASTIVADGSAASGPDISGGVIAASALVENDTGATVTGTYVTGDPALAALANNGGPTLTHAITATSIAFNAGSNPASLTTDQRGTGFTRVRDGATDIGAFEVQTGSGGGGPGPGPGGGTNGGGSGGGGGCAADTQAGWLGAVFALLAAFVVRVRRRRA